MMRRVFSSSDSEAGYYQNGVADSWSRETASNVEPAIMPQRVDWTKISTSLIDVYKERELAKINAMREARGLDPVLRLTSPPPPPQKIGFNNPIALVGVGIAALLGYHLLYKRQR